jgi:transposase InsO family protein
MDAGILQSMGATGVCFDNAAAESLWASLKKEVINRRHWKTRRQAVQAVNTWIRWYNGQRLHSALGYRSPEAFEARLAA